MDDYGFHPSAAIVCDVSSGSEGVGKIDSHGNWDERFGMREKWYERVVQTRFVWENCRYGWTLIFWKYMIAREMDTMRVLDLIGLIVLLVVYIS